MNIYFPKEKDSESRVALNPEIVEKYLKQGLELSIESNLASHIGIGDKEFESLGVRTKDRKLSLIHI